MLDVIGLDVAKRVKGYALSCQENSVAVGLDCTGSLGSG